MTKPCTQRKRRDGGRGKGRDSPPLTRGLALVYCMESLWMMSMMGDTTWVWFWEWWAELTRERGGRGRGQPHHFDAGEEGLEPANSHLTVTVQERQDRPHGKLRPLHSGPHEPTPLPHPLQPHLGNGCQQLPVLSWGRGEGHMTRVSRSCDLKRTIIAEVIDQNNL